MSDNRLYKTVNKKYFIVGIVCLALIGSGLVIFNRFNSQKSTAFRPAVDAEKLTQKYQIPKAMEISGKALTWIDGQRDMKKVYTVGLTCDKDNKCSYIGSNRTGAPAMWARAKYLMAKNDSKSLSILRRDLINYADKKKVPLIQNNFWHCLFMYDIYQSKIADKAFDKYVTNICTTSEYESGILSPLLKTLDDYKKAANNAVYNALGSKTKLDNMISANTSKTQNKDYKEDPEDVRQFFFTVGDRMAYYSIKNDNKVLMKAYGDLMYAADTYTNQQMTIKAHEGCELGVGALMFYQTTKEEQYKKLSEMIFDQQSKKIDKDSEEDSAICAFFADRMFTEFKDEKYIAKKNELLQYQIDHNLGKDGVFYTKFGDKTNKKIRFNSLFAGLLATK